MMEGELRALVRRLLQEGPIDCFIGYAQGADPLRTTPCFVESERQVDRLIWSPLCPYNLASYLPRVSDGRTIGLVLKGCDARAVVELLKQNQIQQEKVVVVGLPCGGQVDEAKLEALFGADAEVSQIENDGEAFSVVMEGEIQVVPKERLLRRKCLSCKHPSSFQYDFTLGEMEPLSLGTGDKDEYAEVEELERLSLAERRAFWRAQFERCIRCYACRDICYACYCKECIFEIKSPRWVEKITTSLDNQTYHLIRAWHMVGRCIDCGECERVCPMKIPLGRLYKMVEREVKETFGYQVGMRVEDLSPLLTFGVGDPDPFL